MAKFDIRHYYEPGVRIPRDLISKIAASDDKPSPRKRPSYGLDSVGGLLMSSLCAPLYLHASLRGKFIVWDELLASLPPDVFRGPAVDLGCGRGMVLLKIAAHKRDLAMRDSLDGRPMSIAPAFGIDIFDSKDQTGNSPESTYRNVAAANVLDHVILHEASFEQRLPFADGIFSLVTTSLAVHNVQFLGRENSLREIGRICAPGGRVILVDLFWYFQEYEELFDEIGFENIQVVKAGARMMYGLFPCKILTATKPKRRQDSGIAVVSEA
ncbi:methyltransferase [Plectosphaerella plurivora]|uniref:Methyltransferase n=1 Tax=Plectosphaerella plurivora TaxID=936078 RepID=A0A9P8VMC8_9PEZI|nr:methyltransferase [Plectosphaerella plurivora]